MAGAALHHLRRFPTCIVPDGSAKPPLVPTAGTGTAFYAADRSDGPGGKPAPDVSGGTGQKNLTDPFLISQHRTAPSCTDYSEGI